MHPFELRSRMPEPHSSSVSLRRKTRLRDLVQACSSRLTDNPPEKCTHLSVLVQAFSPRRLPEILGPGKRPAQGHTADSCTPPYPPLLAPLNFPFRLALIVVDACCRAPLAHHSCKIRVAPVFRLPRLSTALSNKISGKGCSYRNGKGRPMYEVDLMSAIPDGQAPPSSKRDSPWRARL